MQRISSYITILGLSLLLQGCQDGDTSHAVVYISDGSKQCETQSLAPAQTAQTLINAGIDVTKSECGRITGMSVITACGASTLQINLHTIHEANIPDAEDLGFSSVRALTSQTGVGYEVVDCDTRP